MSVWGVRKSEKTTVDAELLSHEFVLLHDELESHKQRQEAMSTEMEEARGIDPEKDRHQGEVQAVNQDSEVLYGRQKLLYAYFDQGVHVDYPETSMSSIVIGTRALIKRTTQNGSWNEIYELAGQRLVVPVEAQKEMDENEDFHVVTTASTIGELILSHVAGATITSSTPAMKFELTVLEIDQELQKRKYGSLASRYDSRTRQVSPPATTVTDN